LEQIRIRLKFAPQKVVENSLLQSYSGDSAGQPFLPYKLLKTGGMGLIRVCEG